jgi:hypothetical protein
MTPGREQYDSGSLQGRANSSDLVHGKAGTTNGELGELCIRRDSEVANGKRFERPSHRRRCGP